MKCELEPIGVDFSLKSLSPLRVKRSNFCWSSWATKLAVEPRAKSLPKKSRKSYEIDALNNLPTFKEDRSLKTRTLPRFLVVAPHLD